MSKLVLHTGQIAPNNVYHGSAESLIPMLEDHSIDAVVCSPPYAEQRKGLYPGIPEAEFPTWFATKIMLPLMCKLKDDANVMVVIHPHVRHGNVSDYVLKTRLAVRDLGYLEPDELVWHKPDSAPLGDPKRPRRSHEQILWFTKGRKPSIDLLVCGKDSKCLGWNTADRHGVHRSKPSKELKEGRARISTVLDASVGRMAHEGGRDHPARYPLALAEKLVKTFCQPGGVVLDPFSGSGTTLEASERHGRRWIGFDMMKEYVEMAKARVEKPLGNAA